METNRKGRGFIKGKLAKAKSFLRVNSNKPSMPLQCSFEKVSPVPYSPIGSLDSSNGQSHSNSSSIQRVVASSQRPTSMPLQYSSKVSPSPYAPYNDYSSMEFPISKSTQKVSDAHKRSFHDYGGDENVDMKAETYISYVLERFKLEKIDTDS